MIELPSEYQKTLKSFFGAYFHEDWRCDDETSDEVVADYVRHASANEVDLLTVALMHLIDVDADNAALEDSLYRQFHANYLPSADGMAVKQWLAGVVAILSAGQRPIN